MIPASLSATAMQTATQCMARYAAENIGRNRTGSGVAAMLGTSVHNALEQYVNECYIKKAMEPTLELLTTFYRMNFMDTFDVPNGEGPDWEDGLEMIQKWHGRTDFSTFDVYSVEKKDNFLLRATDKHGTSHEAPFNYIWDRCDQLAPSVYRIVDYKTIRQGFGPMELRDKIQARAYGLAAQIQFPHATEIWVEFDLLRHESVGIVFSKEDNIATWKFLRKWYKTILDTEAEDAKETVNPDCRWCIRKTTCDAIRRNASVGGVAGLPTLELVDRRAVLDMQIKALEINRDELDKALTDICKNDDIETLASEKYQVYFTRYARRTITRTDILEKVLGPQLFERVGKTSVGMGEIDKLLKGQDLTVDQKRDVRALIGKKHGEPSLKTKPIGTIDAD